MKGGNCSREFWKGKESWGILVAGMLLASGVNFRDWLVFFLNNVHNYDNDYSKDLAELLPHNFNLQNQDSNKTIQ